MGSSSRIAALATLLAAFGSALPARAESLHLFGVTPRSMGLAGAYTAACDDAAALYYNPAGLVRVDGSYVGLSFGITAPSFSANWGDGTPVNDVGAPGEFAYGIHLAWSPKNVLDGNLGFGFSVLLPHRRALEFEVHRFDEPYFVLYENSIDLLQIRLGIAYKLFDLISVGVSGLLLAGLDGRVTLEAPFQSTDMVDPNDRTVLSMNATLPNREFFSLGLQAYPIEGLTLGFSYHPATYVPIKLPIDFTIEILGLEPLRTVAVLDVKVKYQPDYVTFGAAYQLNEALLLSADLMFARYAAYALPTASVALEQRFSEDITLLPPRQPNTSQRDLWVPRLGVEWIPIEPFTVRAGYAFFRTFLRRTDAPVLDSDKHLFTVGGDYAIGSYFFEAGNELNIQAAAQLLLWPSSKRENLFEATPAGHDSITYSGLAFSTTFGAELRY